MKSFPISRADILKRAEASNLWDMINNDAGSVSMMLQQAAGGDQEVIAELRQGGYLEKIIRLIRILDNKTRETNEQLAHTRRYLEGLESQLEQY